ncbi:MAG: TIGR02444 family protein [Cellvibrio sp. 79]|nr:MAG: TIGR02444 family protein [Cellvibrio sp. 79]
MHPSLPIDIGLWDFSVHYYARPGVSPLCLRLQDEHGVNVNVLLWALWLGYRGIRLEPVQLAQALRMTHSWDQHYVLPLRQLRRRMKVEFDVTDASIEAVRTQIKQAELLAEKYLQQILETQISISVARTQGTVDALIAGNLWLYLQPLGVSKASVEELLVLLD